jgi:hypothetical protein
MVDEEQLFELLGELIEMGKAEKIGDMYRKKDLPSRETSIHRRLPGQLDL